MVHHEFGFYSNRCAGKYDQCDERIYRFVQFVSIRSAKRWKPSVRPWKSGVCFCRYGGNTHFVAGLIIIYEAIQNLKHPHEIGQLDFEFTSWALQQPSILLLVILPSVKAKRTIHSHWLQAENICNPTPTHSRYYSRFDPDLFHTSCLARQRRSFVILFSYHVYGIQNYPHFPLPESWMKQIQNCWTKWWIPSEKQERKLDRLTQSASSNTAALCISIVTWLFLVFKCTPGAWWNRSSRKNGAGKFRRECWVVCSHDGCLDFSCKLCVKQDCQVRKNAFVRRLDWTVENISSNSKHKIDWIAFKSIFQILKHWIFARLHRTGNSILPVFQHIFPSWNSILLLPAMALLFTL